jgi:hypothetical protein
MHASGYFGGGNKHDPFNMASERTSTWQPLPRDMSLGPRICATAAMVTLCSHVR